MREIAHQEAMKFLMQGGRWGENLEHQGSEALLSLKGLNGAKHSVVSSFNHLPLKNREDGYVYENPWRPAALLRKRVGRNVQIDRSAPSSDDLKGLQLAFDTYFEDKKFSVNDEKVQYQWLQGFNLPSGYRANKIRIGDDFAITFGGATEYIRIHRCLLVTRGLDRFSFVFPLWYELISITGLTPLVRKWAGNIDALMPLPLHLTQDQVLILHNCNRLCTCNQKRCACDVCTPITVCIAHGSNNCNTCTQHQIVDKHSENVNSYVAFTRELGFQPDF